MPTAHLREAAASARHTTPAAGAWSAAWSTEPGNRLTHPLSAEAPFGYDPKGWRRGFRGVDCTRRPTCKPLALTSHVPSRTEIPRAADRPARKDSPDNDSMDR